MRFSLPRAGIATLFAVACSTSDSGDAPASDIGGTLTIALPVEPSTLFPLLVQAAHEKEVADQIFDALAEIGPDLNTFSDSGWTPRIAESWRWAADSMSLTFKLNPRARWHDGQRVSAHDVRFSLDLIKDPKVLARAYRSVANIDSVSVPDSATAVVWFARRSPEQFYSAAYNIVPVPQHLLRDVDRGNIAGHPFSRSPVGSGPFRFVRWEPRTLIAVEADSTHPLGRPRLNRVIWVLNPEPTAALLNVLSGEIDMFEIVTPDGMRRIAAQTDVKAVPYANPNYAFLGFNLRDQRNPERPHPLFGDANLRRALAMAIDRRALLKNVYDTLAWLGSGPVSRMTATADTMIRMLPFDSTGADRLLDSLGWRDQNGDGVREKGGRPLRFGILVPSSSAGRRRYAELLQAQLKPHGAQVDVDVVDFTAFGARLQGKFDALIHSWLSEPSPSAIRDQWHSMPVTARAQNFLLYSNPAVDAAMDSAIVESNTARSRAQYRRAYQGIIDDAAGVWLYENRYFMALNRRVQPVIRGSDVWWRYLREWSIPAADRLPRHNQ